MDADVVKWVAGLAALGVVVVAGMKIHDCYLLDKAKRGPARLSNVQAMKLANGRAAVAVIGMVDVDTSGNETSTAYKLYRVDSIDVASGQRLARLWWEKNHDRPDCRGGDSGVLWCKSRKLDRHARSTDTLKRLDVGERPEDQSTQIFDRPQRETTQFCRRHVAITATTRFSMTRSPSTAQKAIRVRDRERRGERHTCPDRYLEPRFLCSTPQAASISVGPFDAIVFTHAESLIEERDTTLRLSAVDADCRRVWDSELPPGRIVYAAVLDGVLVVAIDGPHRGKSGDHVIGIDPETGVIAWDVKQ